MRQKLKCVLLVDDDEATNFVHTMVVKQADCAEMVKSVQNGRQALEYLSEVIEGTYPPPDFIFLDINMPEMDGWEFLRAYEKLPTEIQVSTIIVLLTTPLSSDDAEKAKKIPTISGFKNKMLSLDTVKELIHENFPHLL